MPRFPEAEEVHNGGSTRGYFHFMSEGRPRRPWAFWLLTLMGLLPLMAMTPLGIGLLNWMDRVGATGCWAPLWMSFVGVFVLVLLFIALSSDRR